MFILLKQNKILIKIDRNLRYLKNYSVFFLNNLKIYLKRRFKDDRDTIIIWVSGGLCNRLCTIISTQIACKEKNKKLKIVWRKNTHCGCDFNDLFSNNFDVVDTANRIDFNCWNRFNVFLSSPHKTMFYVDFWFRPFQKVLIDPDRARFDSGVPEFYLKKFSEGLKNLKIADIVTQKIISLPKNTIGVHIRKSDFLNKARKLNYSWFEQKMHEEIEKDYTVSFFLATDCVETKNKMIDIFGNKILYYPFNFSVDEKNFLEQRAYKEGMQEALLDLITLSKTKKIIGSYKSSFSWIAGMWGEIPVEYGN